ncbi:MAG: hypothetical protein WAN35_07225 [Terracidiphilus sp.]
MRRSQCRVLSAWGIALGDMPAAVEMGARASRMQAIQLPLTGKELLAVLSTTW